MLPVDVQGLQLLMGCAARAQPGRRSVHDVALQRMQCDIFRRGGSKKCTVRNSWNVYFCVTDATH
jgi:hypothetical protein